jgi:hypothetical protein
MAGDLSQGVIEVREVVDGHVANEGTANFVVAGAAVQPAKEEEKLEERGEGNDDPVGVHRREWNRLQSVGFLIMRAMTT